MIKRIKNISHIFISILIILLLSVVIKHALKQNNYYPPESKDDEIIKAVDKNKDGQIDNWVYKTKDGIPTRWIQDADFDGVPEKWSFFKNGEAFLDEEDLDKDGKIDIIYVFIQDEGNKIRTFSLILNDKARNIFIEHEDTGWLHPKTTAPE